MQHDLSCGINEFSQISITWASYYSMWRVISLVHMLPHLAAGLKWHETEWQRISHLEVSALEEEGRGARSTEEGGNKAKHGQVVV